MVFMEFTSDGIAEREGEVEGSADGIKEETCCPCGDDVRPKSVEGVLGGLGNSFLSSVSMGDAVREKAGFIGAGVGNGIETETGDEAGGPFSTSSLLSPSDVDPVRSSHSIGNVKLPSKSISSSSEKLNLQGSMFSSAYPVIAAARKRISIELSRNIILISD